MAWHNVVAVVGQQSKDRSANIKKKQRLQKALAPKAAKKDSCLDSQVAAEDSVV